MGRATVRRSVEDHGAHTHGFAMKGDDLKAREAGCDGYITKPIDIDTRRLAAQLADIIQRAKEHR